MKHILSAAAIVLAAQPVFALSCMAPDVADSYQTAANSPDSYVVVHGYLSHHIKTVDHSTGDVNNPREVSFQAQLSGNFLTAEGFNEAYALPVTVNLRCMVAWCGSLPKAGRVLAFVHQTSLGHQILDIGPCGGELFADPTAAMLERVYACHTGEPCQAENR